MHFSNKDAINDDKIILKPRQLYNYLTCEMYRSRCNFTPLMLELVIGGMQDDETPFLGHVSPLGRAFEDDFISSGLGGHMAIPLLREYERKLDELNENTVQELIHNCMEVLYYRDCRSTADYSTALCTKRKSGFEVDLSQNSSVQNWDVAKLIFNYN